MKNRLTTLAAVFAAFVAALVMAPSPASAAIPDPATDPFYAAPANLGTLAPGTVIRTRAVVVNLIGYGGFGLPVLADSKQIMVRSNDSKGNPAAVIATVLTPLVGARHQLLAYQPAIDSLGSKCNPSYTLRDGTEKEAAIIATAVAAGLTVVVPDHEGPRNAYAAGRMAGHAVLDSIRGAISLPSSNLAGAATKVGMVGYSGGAIATGWAGQLAPSYAPELHVVGVASGGTPADLEAAGSLMDGGPFGGLYVGASLGMSREYPELRSIFNAAGIAMSDQIKDYCDAQLALRAYDSVEKYSDDPAPLKTPVAQAVLADNKLGATPPAAPYYLWQSKFDELIPWDSVNKLDQQWCGEGAQVQFVTNYTSEHVTGAIEMIPTALPWLLDRFDGKAFTGNCPA